jgi:DNA modification methylase
MDNIPIEKFFSINDAACWASSFFNKNITPSNITYLINYGKISKIDENNKTILLRSDIENYFNSLKSKEKLWKQKLGNDLNWSLSFDNLKETITTKHVHRLHPYKGKYIPQLVEYFIDEHIDDFKKEVYFKKNDIILDPFCGSGTTLVQANEMEMNAIGIDVSEFNTLISNVKLSNIDLTLLLNETNILSKKLNEYVQNSKHLTFEFELTKYLNEFNAKYFPVRNFNVDVKSGKINKSIYIKEKVDDFLKVYYNLIKKYDIKLTKENPVNFLEKWYFLPTLDEIYFLNNEILKIENNAVRDVIKVILSRTIRSCRATTHYDLGTLKNPATEPYYCNKHYRICKPLFSIIKWWDSYIKDTIKRLNDFKKVKTNTTQLCLMGDSRTIDLSNILNEKFGGRKIDGIFSSPPYVGLINYHEQHAYSYNLFNFKRNDESEIGSLFKGKGLEAQKSYVNGISSVLNNCKKYMKNNCNIFLVANDNYNLYPQIAKMSGMHITETFKRPVLNRIEGKNAYCETIFRMKIGE